ncbi:hypothetical protein OA496_02400 [Pelagibacteraceae bacterium]|nr:hypothetical protein [Pelagibacteraceae bacterium]
MISGILGHPLTNPRSIKIWKKYFKKKKISSKMLKFDIRPKNLNNFFNFIRNEQKFRASAVTMPYKKKVLKFLDKIDDFAKKAGSVNLIIKKNNKLIGHNTDVYGAYCSIQYKIRLYKKIIIIGLGGSGQAIFNFLSNKFKKKNFYLISSTFKKKKTSNVFVLKKLTKKELSEKILIINCTPLGSNLKKIFLKKTPIKKDLIKKIKKGSLIFDIIYSPKVTIFSKECKKNNLEYLNGIKMNTLQALRALKLAFN